jgi:uncharacterized protein YciI
MKYFLVLFEYKTSLDNIKKVTDDHRNFLKTGYEKGFLLLSGPQVPRTGGLVVAKAQNRKDLEDFFSNDPYNLNSYTDYKFIEFDLKSHQPILDEWLS